VALAMPFVVIALLLVAQVALVLRHQLLAVQAAREGARAGAVAPGDASGAAVGAAHASVPVDPARMRVDARIEGEWVTVDVTVISPTDLPLVGAVIGDIAVTATAQMRVEPGW
jgi:hypothetical protein